MRYLHSGFSLRGRLCGKEAVGGERELHHPPPLLAAKVWEQIDSVMFSKEFTDLLLAKFGLTGATQAHHDNRMQTDRSGYSVGVHADSVRKLITMQFYFPLNTQSELFYGTCVHSQEQFDNRDQKCNGCAPCYRKFKFQNNAGYAFPVHNTSFHSAPAVIQGLGERRTALLNIYKTDIGKSRGRVGG
ncbi:hypothetical protein CYMTET_30111 [Cymbomonas tetramitiformis]|uniref:Uncharacterized protein n=1 Tax=Cymbomonas tetramitiformis TaxID=36881 RepID=A0AAE0KUH2_9CHLO|nr:hypothetical protein CYMTET_30111 [Cymbomonas tetramitiformis]